MTTKITQRPYETTKMAAFLRGQIDTLGGLGISQREIASEAGYDKPNFISMLKRGETKVPLDKVEVLAKALRVDPVFFFRLACEQPNTPIGIEFVNRVLKNPATDNQAALIAVLADVFGATDPKFTDGELAEFRALVEGWAEARKSHRSGVSPVPKSL